MTDQCHILARSVSFEVALFSLPKCKIERRATFLASSTPIGVTDISPGSPRPGVNRRTRNDPEGCRSRICDPLRGRTPLSRNPVVSQRSTTGYFLPSLRDEIQKSATSKSVSDAFSSEFCAAGAKTKAADKAPHSKIRPKNPFTAGLICVSRWIAPH